MYRLSAYSFHYVLIVGFVSALICSSLIVLNGFYSRSNVIVEADLNRINKFQSALAYTLSNSEDMPFNTESKFDEQTSIFKTAWGEMINLRICVAEKDSNYCQSYLTAGTSKQRPLDHVLYLSNRGKNLIVAGSTILNGIASLPNASLKKGTVRGISSSGMQIALDTVLSSDVALPAIVLQGLKATLGKEDLLTNQVIELSFNSFLEPTLIIDWQSNVLEDINLEGNFIIRSAKPLEFDKSAKLNSVIVSAPSVTIKSGFIGSLQIYAEDTVVIKKGGQLNYPSIISMKGDHPLFIMEDGSRISGAVIISPKRRTIGDVNAYLSEDSHIVGEVYIEGVAELRGKIEGQASCDELLYRASSGKYQNYLVDAEIYRMENKDYYVDLVPYHEEQQKVIQKVY